MLIHIIDILRNAEKLCTKDVYFFLSEKELPADSPSRKLVEGILNGEITNDTNAQKYIYGDTSKRSGTRAYEKLKERVFWKLADSVFHTDENLMKIPRALVRYQGNKYAALAKILSVRSSPEASAYVAKAHLHNAIEHHQAEAVVDFLHILMNYHVWKSEKQYTKKMKEYLRLHRYWSEVLHAEEVLNMEYNLILFEHNVNQPVLPELQDKQWLIDKTRDLSERVSAAYNKYQTILLRQMSLKVRLSLAIFYNDPNTAREVLEQMQEYQERFPHLMTSSQIGDLTDTVCYIFIENGLYYLAEKYVVHGDKNHPTGSILWFRQRYITIITFIAVGRYAEAQDILQEVHSHIKFKLLPDMLKYAYQHLNLYSILLFQTKEHTPITRKKSLSLREFSRSFLPSNKSIGGSRIQALISYVLYCLNEQDREHIVLTNDNLQRMRRKILDEASPRLSLFFKMINAMIKHDFDKKIVEQKTEAMFQTLRTTPHRSYTAPNEYSELLPVDILWDRIVNKFCS